MKKDNQIYIIRTDRAGVFFGNIESREGSEAVLTNVRNIHYWEGAASLLQLANEGTKKPQSCRFTITVPKLIVLGVIEIIPCTDSAITNINNVPEWKK